MEVITSVMFEDEETITASKGLWLFNQNVELTSDGCKSGKCGFFNSSVKAKLELAYFSNAFDNFDSFSVRLFFKKTQGAGLIYSLVDNAWCSGGSVVAKYVSGTVFGYFANGTEIENRANFDFPASVRVILNLQCVVNNLFGKISVHIK